MKLQPKWSFLVFVALRIKAWNAQKVFYMSGGPTRGTPKKPIKLKDVTFFEASSITTLTVSLVKTPSKPATVGFEFIRTANSHKHSNVFKAYKRTLV